jgi:hypothetical protein
MSAAGWRGKGVYHLIVSVLVLQDEKNSEDGQQLHNNVFT